jgi:hypothetical protein
MLDTKDGELILGLQLLIARAAQKDSLSWWEDDSLTPSGLYLLERLFFVDPNEAGRKLALEAARVRHQAAFGAEKNVLHLFHLDQTGEIELYLQGISLSPLSIPLEPVKTTENLRQLLLEKNGSHMDYQVIGERPNNRLEIKIGGAHSRPDVIHFAKTLAWATLEGSSGKPVFPYIRET